MRSVELLPYDEELAEGIMRACDIVICGCGAWVEPFSLCWRECERNRDCN